MFRARSLFKKTRVKEQDQEGCCSKCGGELYTHRE